MIEELARLLQTEYQYAVEAQIVDAAEAEVARTSGQMESYFDLALYLQLADICWALERWDEAKHWYLHNAQVLLEKHAWRARYGEADRVGIGIADWEASALVKAGQLQAGRKHMQQAIEMWRGQAGSELALTQLGLHAAQAGWHEFALYALRVIEARQELPGGTGAAASQARRRLHYEPAQVNLLLGRWDGFGKAVEELAEGERLVEGRPGLAFPAPLQAALAAASRGLRTLAALHAGTLEPEQGRQMARQAFEEAMLHFYQFDGQIDWNLYFMRLNTRFADELAAGQPINPIPFIAVGY